MLYFESAVCGRVTENTCFTCIDGESLYCSNNWNRKHCLFLLNIVSVQSFPGAYRRAIVCFYSRGKLAVYGPSQKLLQCGSFREQRIICITFAQHRKQSLNSRLFVDAEKLEYAISENYLFRVPYSPEPINISFFLLPLNKIS